MAGLSRVVWKRSGAMLKEEGLDLPGASTPEVSPSTEPLCLCLSRDTLRGRCNTLPATPCDLCMPPEWTLAGWLHLYNPFAACCSAYCLRSACSNTGHLRLA